jgi:hypothetical protein
MRSLLALFVLVGACSKPLDVSGDYTVALTNGANGCNIPSWSVGSVTSGVPLSITQDDVRLTAVVTGSVGLGLTAVTNSNTFSGTVDGNHLDLTLAGSMEIPLGLCRYTIDVTTQGDLEGDTLTGTVTYTPVTNMVPDCAPIQNCQSTQTFSGTRPPK